MRLKILAFFVGSIILTTLFFLKSKPKEENIERERIADKKPHLTHKENHKKEKSTPLLAPVKIKDKKKPEDKLALFLEELSLISQKNEPFSEDTWNVLTPYFVQNFKDNPKALSILVARFIRNPISTKGKILAILLGRSDHEVVTSGALKLFAHKDAPFRTAGIQLLTRQGVKTREALDATYQILENDKDPQAVKAAFFLLRSLGKDQGDPVQISGYAFKHAYAEDIRLKVAALSALGQFSEDKTYFEPVMEALDHNQPLVRREAAKAFLKKPHLASEDAISRMIFMLGDHNEKTTVKKQCLKALSAMKLSPARAIEFNEAKSRLQ